MDKDGRSLPDSDLSEEAIYNLEAPTVSECVDLADPTSDIHDQLTTVPFSSLVNHDADLDLDDSRSGLVAPAKPGPALDNNTLYI